MTATTQPKPAPLGAQELFTLYTQAALNSQNPYWEQLTIPMQARWQTLANQLNARLGAT